MKTQPVIARIALGTLVLTLGCVHTVFGEIAQVPSHTNAQAFGSYACVQRGPHSKVWQMATLQTNASGIVRTNFESYTEVATGLCYLQNGQYMDSVEEIDSAPEGAQATQGRYQVHWMANANTPTGAVSLTTPDGKQLHSTVYGLAYTDTSSGSNVMLAQLQDCTGVIVDPNVVLYTNAFSNLTADIRYTYRKAGMSQDIILKQQPPSPADYGFNPATTRLQVVTEFFNAPEPSRTTITNSQGADDRSLNFGNMKMGVGHAFLFKTAGGTEPGGAVIKHWKTLENRTFLIEEIPYAAISNILSTLHSSLMRPDKAKVRRTVLLTPTLQRPKVSPTAGNPAKMLKTTMRETGFVIDYDIVSDTSDFTFQGDTTYLITSLCNLAGTTVLEGGAVIKYTNNSTAEIELTNLVCETAPYRPAVFTSINDNTVGVGISGSTGNPWGDNAGLMGIYCLGESSIWGNSGGTIALSNVRFSHLAAAVSLQSEEDDTGGNLTMNDFQVVDCAQAIMSEDASCYLFNGLIYGVGSLFGCFDGKTDNAGENLCAVNLTVDHCGNYASDQTSMMCFTNCLFAEVTNIASYPVRITNASYFKTNDSGLFQSVGAGAHYLADNTYRGLGTTGLADWQLADLAVKTTYPPITNGTYNLTNDYTFFPQAARDNSGSAIDIGYHYDPIDYGIVFQVLNATATVLPGTALAIGGPNYGFWLHAAANLQMKGTATSPINIFRYAAVQEMPYTNWVPTFGYTSPYYLISYSSGSNSANSFSFVNWSGLANDKFFESLTDPISNAISLFGCQIYNGVIDDTGPDFLATNCLWQRVALTLDDTGIDGANNHTFYNNLFEGGSLTTYHDAGAGTWTFSDNLFNGTSISQDADMDVSQYNAFITNCNRLSPTNAHDIVLTASPAFETNTIGNYYYPSGLPLINAGSRSAADAGLYHFTVLTNANSVEGTDTVSIGFHYVGVGTNNLPLDSNGDGIPDYLEDKNGNGLVDSGEIAWDVAGDLGLTVVITQPTSNTKIP